MLAGAPCYAPAKEREGAPLSLPRRSRPLLIIFPSFFVATLNKTFGHIQLQALVQQLPDSLEVEIYQYHLTLQRYLKFFENFAHAVSSM